MPTRGRSAKNHDRAASPDTLFGWGTPRGLAALAYTSSTGIIPPSGSEEAHPRVVALASPSHTTATLWVTSPDNGATLSSAELRICTITGRCVRRLTFSLPPASRHATRLGTRQTLVRWDLRDDRGRRVPAGRYFAVVQNAGMRLSGSLIVD